jgi:hypothetical protein
MHKALLSIRELHLTYILFLCPATLNPGSPKRVAKGTKLFYMVLLTTKTNGLLNNTRISQGADIT